MMAATDYGTGDATAFPTTTWAEQSDEEGDDLVDLTPLWLPEGSIRAIIAIGLVGSAIAGVFVLGVEASSPLILLAGIISTFYFDSRTAVD